MRGEVKHAKFITKTLFYGYSPRYVEEFILPEIQKELKRQMEMMK